METKPYLIFKQNGLLCGVEVGCVREIFFLPELAPIAEAPQDIVGAIDLRGSILPVMDLNLRFGYLWQEYSVTDSAIVIEWQEFRVAIVVNQVSEVKQISQDAITPQLSYGRDKPEESNHFLAGFARCGAEIIMLLDLDRLIRDSPEKTKNTIPVSAAESQVENQKFPLETEPKLLAEHPKSLDTPRIFGTNATAAEKAIFRERADNLRLQDDRKNSAAINMSLAVVVFNGEYFGVNLEVVREFTDIRQVTPVPCTPDRIIGNMNLRGEILTLVDIRKILNISADTKFLSKAIVVEIEDLVAGIVVDEILDIIHLNMADIATIPAALNSANREYLRGTAFYKEKIIAVLHLHKLLTKGGVIVDEEV
ncbi:chemotaxis protein CheW [Tychonema sp. LEGE 07203]|uniref:chemotaxis protein CheW n=1 Tax=Tychonema sp. LEGE 07203 TaxID=1828671 RepID=UPI001882008A|nr:chemotaxis protein CheW [Tychonema sp. LEGE 07203]MBE9093478.1 chemotaxis protein CheW [Tychonema sp. LEGE 07203]